LALLAERGLRIESYDNQVLLLRYDPEKDSETLQGHAPDVSALTQYAAEVLRGMPGGDTLFPRLQEVRVEVSVTS
jgi:hypothetical protein